MPDTITITDVAPLVDGVYTTDVLDRPMKPIEWSWVKKLSGYLPNTFMDGLMGGDPELICAFAVVTLVRHGKIDKGIALRVGEMLKDPDSDEGSVHMELSEVEVEGDARPPELSQSGSETNDSTTTSGTDSVKSSESPGSPLPSIGNGGSDRRFTFDRETLKT